MNRRHLIEALLTCGREIRPVPDEVRERIFARVLAASSEREPPPSDGAGACHAVLAPKVAFLSPKRLCLLPNSSSVAPRSAGRKSGRSASRKTSSV